MASAKLITSEVVRHTPWPMLGFVHELTVENRKLRLEIEALQAKLNQNSANSNKPPSSDSPFKPRAKKTNKTEPRKKRIGVRQQCLRPTEITELHPGPCACGCPDLIDPEPYYIHQHIEIPEPRLDVEHIILYQGRCSRCGQMVKALVSPEKRTGFGPRLSANIAELCGIHGDSRRAVQDYLLSVFGLPISQGGIQKVIDRVSQAIKPHYDSIAKVARSAPVGHVDETSWRRKAKLAWLWVLASSRAALFMIHPRRSKAAFEELVQGWSGILVADGYAVYRQWVGLRQACLAHLIREAEGLAERKDAALAQCGTWARDELRRLCHMAKAPPTVGEWRAFIARLHRLISIYGDRKDPAGRLVRHLEREMEHLCGCSSKKPALSRRTTSRSGRCDSGCSGAREVSEPPVKVVTTGLNASSACAIRAEFREGEPTRCWSMRWRPLFKLGLRAWIGFRRCLSRERVLSGCSSPLFRR